MRGEKDIGKDREHVAINTDEEIANIESHPKFVWTSCARPSRGQEKVAKIKSKPECGQGDPQGKSGGKKTNIKEKQTTQSKPEYILCTPLQIKSKLIHCDKKNSGDKKTPVVVR